jgi:hypothetical protein
VLDGIGTVEIILFAASAGGPEAARDKAIILHRPATLLAHDFSAWTMACGMIYYSEARGSTRALFCTALVPGPRDSSCMDWIRFGDKTCGLLKGVIFLRLHVKDLWL